MHQVPRKSSWDHIYTVGTPAKYFNELIKLDYGHNQEKLLEILSEHKLLPSAKHIREQRISSEPVRVIDIGCCYGNTTLMVSCGFTWNDTIHFWQGKRKMPASRKNFYTTGVDISNSALQYGLESGTFDQVICSNINTGLEDQPESLEASLKEADILLMVTSSCYFDISAIRYIFKEFCGNDSKHKMILYDQLLTFDTRDLSPANLLPPGHNFLAITETCKHRDLTAEEQAQTGQSDALTRLYVLY